MLLQLFLVYWWTNSVLLTGWQYVNDFLFHNDDDDDDDLVKGSGQRQRAAGTLMEVDGKFKKKESNGEDKTNTKVRDCMPPYV